MQFNSYIFILCFLPVFLILYFLLSKWSVKVGNLFLVAASCLFYLYAGKKMFLVLCIDIVVNYLFVKGIQKTRDRAKKTMLFFGVSANILLLLYVKYLNFFITTVDSLTGLTISPRDILVPLGVSFFTFQQIGYLVDTFHGKTEQNTILDYILFVVFFPKISMGPITKQEMLIPQFHDPKKKKCNPDNLIRGIRMFTLGLAKKVLLAETFATAVNYTKYYELSGMATSMEILLIAVCYAFEIYFDFSGYTDMAQGIAKMIGIDLADNFNSPYQALSIRDFWKRWHISLTKFLTEYLYIPLGGSRKGTVRTYLNTMIVFLVSGLWHGANWTFILWGALHGGLQILDRIWEKGWKRIPKVIRWTLTFLALIVLWLLFQADSVASWWTDLKIFFTSGNFKFHETIPVAFLIPEVKGAISFFGWLVGASNLAILSAQTTASYIMMAVFFAGSFAICLGAKNVTRRSYPNTVWTLIGSALLLVLCITGLGSESMFVYNNF